VTTGVDVALGAATGAGDGVIRLWIEAGRRVVTAIMEKMKKYMYILYADLEKNKEKIKPPEKGSYGIRVNICLNDLICDWSK
jgi:hypothetical protein